ncbi:UNVERIFIED_CONTAM: hypothetical protein HDU68_011894 [Siphonaria sp. JEL0065]|nr:hypothetical protein HDU68_011894 [Siphonaria sp. JEL0065]
MFLETASPFSVGPLSSSKNRRSGGRIAASSTGTVAFTCGQKVVAVGLDGNETSCEVGGPPFDLAWSITSPLILAVTLPNAVKLLDSELKELSTCNPFESLTVSHARISLAWNPLRNVLLVYAPGEISIHNIKGNSLNLLLSLKYAGLQKCVWSLDGSKLYLFKKGSARILCLNPSYTSIQDDCECNLPLNQSMRAAVFAESDVLLLTFDMPEENIFSQFDISGLRGWQTPPSDLIVPSKSIQERTVEPFSMDLGIPTSSLSPKTASSTLASFRIKENTLSEISRTELPILMPDVLLWVNKTRSVITCNNSIGAIFIYHLPTFIFDNQKPPTQVIRLEPKHFPMGATFLAPSLNAASIAITLLILSATHANPINTTESANRSVTGFSTSSIIDVELKVVSYACFTNVESSQTNDQNGVARGGMTGLTNRLSLLKQHFKEQNNVFGGLVSSGSHSVNSHESEDDEGESSFLAHGLKLPGHDAPRKLFSPIEDVTVSGREKEFRNHATSREIRQFMEKVETRLDRIERQQEEVLELLRALALR